MANQSDGGNGFWQIINTVGNFPPCRPAKYWIYPDIPEKRTTVEPLKNPPHTTVKSGGGGGRGDWQYIMTRPYRSSDLCYRDKYLVYNKLYQLSSGHAGQVIFVFSSLINMYCKKETPSPLWRQELILFIQDLYDQHSASAVLMFSRS